MFRKILIANRGEIAVRVIRACREMGIPAVAVFSEVDREARHVRLSDEAYGIGKAPAAQSYLNAQRILDTAERCGADAVHPGYGFLSENAEFAEACADRGIKFIGPPASAIRAMGIKTRAREIMSAAGVPVVPGALTATARPSEAAAIAQELGYPVMLKAAAGGGGKGMRLVGGPGELAGAWAQAREEARKAFGDPAVYVERAIVRPRHVEVQILADEHGATVHLGERECSLQRRHQKVLEESPSPLVERRPGIRGRLYDAAVAAARAVSYANAGTIEFLMDEQHRFYFLEMNTRLQVEHPVTELVTGIDMVRQQIQIAAGKRLEFSQEDVKPRGHAIECRIYAEDPRLGFMPSPGRIRRMSMPDGPGVRVDLGANEGWTVPIEYDPLIAKLCTWAGTRQKAISRLRTALRETSVEGIATTVDLFRALVEDARFRAGDVDTEFLERELPSTPANLPEASGSARLAAMLACVQWTKEHAASKTVRPARGDSRWGRVGRRSMLGDWSRDE